MDSPSALAEAGIANKVKKLRSKVSEPAFNVKFVMFVTLVGAKIVSILNISSSERTGKRKAVF